ncbi:MAG: hypothetical protein ABI333_19670 [bacterium]
MAQHAGTIPAVILGLGLALAGGCVAERLGPASELTDEPQVLTIRAEPPEARPGDVVTLDALVHWPGDDWEAHWLVCVPERVDALSTCVGDSFPDDGDLPDCLTEPYAPLCRLPSGPVTQVLVPPFPPLPPGESFPVFVELLVARASAGWQGCRQAVADAEPTPDCLLALKTVWLTSEPEPNRNPEVTALVVDGVTYDATAPLVVGADASDLERVEVELELVVDATGVDEFVQDEDAPEEVALDVSWFVTCGSVSKASNDFLFSDEPNPGDVNCVLSADATAPPECEPAQAVWKPREPGTCVVHAVVRDGFGGVGHVTRVFDVRGTAATEKSQPRRMCGCRAGPEALPSALPPFLLIFVWLLWRRRKSL